MLEYQLSRGPVSLQVIAPVHERGCGYFTDLGDIEREVDALDQLEVSAIYTGLNPSPGPVGFRRHGAAALWPTDASVTRRCRVLIDADAVRPTGPCATDAEVARTQNVTSLVREFLFSRSVPQKSAAIAGSGNGTHTLLFTDWPCDERTDAAVKGLLKGLSSRFSTADVTIDASVADRRRITKLYGCMTRKTAAPGRPWRRSGVIEMPELQVIEFVPLEVVEHIVEEVGASVPSKSSMPKAAVWGSVERKLRLLEQWASEGVFPAILFVKDADSAGNITVVLECCPRDPEHTGTSAALLLFADGGWQPCCQHHSCKRLSRKEWWAEVQAQAGRKITFDRELVRR